ncbi:uncharacterized protein [Venturia canescens]|uniref:uncharacterized protein n=1 Tax=Venturia canescens TaxID=32260 RepID=UPI001C9C85AD|nr:uncharacterized protein LOC122408058 [Venturia canescens]
MEEIVFNNDVKITSFETLLKRDVTVLQIVGLHSLADVFTAERMKPKIWESITFEIGLVNLGAVVLFETCKVFDVWGRDPEYIVGALSAIVSGTVCLLKGGRLWFWREELRNLLRFLAVLWNKENTRDSIENIKMAEATCLVTKIHIMMVTILCLSYALRPYILLLTYQMYEKNLNESYDYTVTVYTALYPWSTGTTIKYMLCVTWEQFVLCVVALYWMAADIIFAQLTTHMAIQFRVLWNDLEHITISDNGQKETNEIKLRHQLSAIAKRHCDLYTHCEMIERIFNPIVFLTLSFTAAHMCLCAFHLQK